MAVLLLCLSTLLFSVAGKVTLEKRTCTDEYPHKLDVGIYWAGVSKFAINLEKSCAGAISANYNPEKPSFIITHGAQPDAVKNNATRFGYQTGFGSLMYGWISQGWNVGVFQWTQFADEPLQNFERAQAKAWDPRYFSNMEYTYRNEADPKGTVRTGQAPVDRTVPEIFADEILAHNITRLRLAGHSLGSQVVVNTAWTLHEMDMHIVSRVALLDPVFSSLPQGFLVSSPYGRYIVDAIGARMNLMNDVIFEVYHTSNLNKCVRSVTVTPEILSAAAYSRIIINQWGEEEAGKCYSSDLWGDPEHLRANLSHLQVQLINQHAYAVRWYMESINADSKPKRCDFVDLPHSKKTCVKRDSLALSAAMPDAQVRAFIYEQSAGKMYFRQYDNGDRSEAGSTMTLTTADDLFYLTN